jgi:hypothetical protein
MRRRHSPKKYNEQDAAAIVANLKTRHLFSFVLNLCKIWSLGRQPLRNKLIGKEVFNYELQNENE